MITAKTVEEYAKLYSLSMSDALRQLKIDELREEIRMAQTLPELRIATMKLLNLALPRLHP